MGTVTRSFMGTLNCPELGDVSRKAARATAPVGLAFCGGTLSVNKTHLQAAYKCDEG